jgi:mono/diheme cytochrome c family protein
MESRPPRAISAVCAGIRFAVVSGVRLSCLIAIVLAGCAFLRPAPQAPSAADDELRSLFAREVQPIVTYRCAGCHAPGGCCSKFLAPRPDMYGALKSWPQLLGPTPARSRLYTKGDHEGPAFPRAEAKVIARWIRAEASLRAQKGP